MTGVAGFSASPEAGSRMSFDTRRCRRRAASPSATRPCGSNIKTAVTGTYHHVSPKHAQAYLTSFAYRFNRRRQLDSIIERLAWAAVHTAPQPYRVIVSDA